MAKSSDIARLRKTPPKRSTTPQKPAGGNGGKASQAQVADWWRRAIRGDEPPR